MEAYSSFLNAKIDASRSLASADFRRKVIPTADDEEVLDNPKFLKRKLPEPFLKGVSTLRVSHTELIRALQNSKRASMIAWRLLDML
jgi:hypothetical protein